MAPTKLTRPVILPVATRGRVLTRKVTATTTATKEVRGKRKAEASPPEETTVKRSALGDVTNAITSLKEADDKTKKEADDKTKKEADDKTKKEADDKTKKEADDKTKKVAVAKKVTVQSRVLPTIKNVIKPRRNKNLVPPPPAHANKVQTRALTRSNVSNQNQTVQKPTETLKENPAAAKVKTRLSNEFEKTEESLYSTAIEDIRNSSTQSNSSKYTSTRSSVEESKPTNVALVAQQMEKKLNLGNHDVPEHINDFDKENWDDVFQASHYAMDIFNYLKSREPLFAIRDYMDRQVCLTRWMRSLLVDWMVEIQESFELNHETLYLGVKLVDLYLSKMTVGKETLQLVGASAMFIASKYDERIPPSVDDFLYICDGAYSRRELLKMEINLLKVCDFDLGIPLSYRFLRRYARCAKVPMPILTLARFILEYSLMNYSTVTIPDSKLGAASLYLALQMKQISGWTSTLQFYTGYKLDEIIEIVHLLNNDLHKKPKEQLMTVRNKYSHKIFFEVAKTPLLKNNELKP